MVVFESSGLFPNNEVQQLSENFRTEVRGLSEDLRGAYKFTWKVFLKSYSFMGRGAKLVNKITRQAKAYEDQSAANTLTTLLEDVQGLLHLHEEADEKLEGVYRKVSYVTADAKSKTLEMANKVEEYQRGWTAQQKLTVYGFGVILGAFTGGVGFAGAGAVFAGIYELLDNDNQNIMADKYNRVAQNFHNGYDALNQTRSILNKHTQTQS
jgi:hypothetical protein